MRKVYASQEVVDYLEQLAQRQNDIVGCDIGPHSGKLFFGSRELVPLPEPAPMRMVDSTLCLMPAEDPIDWKPVAPFLSAAAWAAFWFLLAFYV